MASPEGTIIATTADGVAWGIASDTGTMRWKRDVGIVLGNYPPGTVVGIGDIWITRVERFPTKPEAYRRADGEPVPLSLGGFKSGERLSFATSRALVANVEGPVRGSYPEIRTSLFDRCGKPLTASTAEAWPFLVDLDANVVAWLRKSGDSLYQSTGIVDSTGAVIHESDRPALPIAVGADGTIYGLNCEWVVPENGVQAKKSDLVAFDRTLHATWTLPLNGPCPASTAALASDGSLFLLRKADDGAEIIKVQTTSPGLAPTEWPTAEGGNLGSRWIPGAAVGR